MEVQDGSDCELTIKWVNRDAWAQLEANLDTKAWAITHSSLDDGSEQSLKFQEGISDNVSCDACSLSQRDAHQERMEARHKRLEGEGKIHFADA